MTIDNANTYKFDFADLQNIDNAFKASAINPSGEDGEALSKIFLRMAVRGGIVAAFNRLLPDTMTTDKIIPFPDGTPFMESQRKVDGLILTRMRDFSASPWRDMMMVGTPLDDEFQAIVFEWKDNRTGVIRPGSWLQNLQDAANKAPMHRHESPAAFQLWLRSHQVKPA